MKLNREDWTFDCEPSLTDSQVLDFCKDGYMLLEGVVPDEINKRTCAYLEGKVPAQPSFLPNGLTQEDVERMSTSNEPSSILLEDWFIEHVLLNKQLIGILRSLLGRNVGLPVLVSKHSQECPAPAQQWHYDADHLFGPELNHLEVFYFPQDTPVEFGPTELVPGSHISPTHREYDETGVPAKGPAGTFGIHIQSIFHRRGASTIKGIRHMLKYSYWRTAAPVRDWIVEPNFDFHSAYYGGHRTAHFVGHMFYWLCGKEDEYRLIGGQAWPWSHPNQIGPSYGFGRREGYLPDWRRQSPDGYIPA